MLNKKYKEHFGFTEAEVVALCEKLNVPDDLSAIKLFYNGYNIRGAILYNPWFLMNSFEDMELRPFWVMTFNND